MLYQFQVCDIVIRQVCIRYSALTTIKYSHYMSHSRALLTILFDHIPDIVLFIFVSYLYKWKIVTLNPLHQFRPPAFTSGNHQFAFFLEESVLFCLFGEQIFHDTYTPNTYFHKSFPKQSLTLTVCSPYWFFLVYSSWLYFLRWWFANYYIDFYDMDGSQFIIWKAPF